MTTADKREMIARIVADGLGESIHAKSPAFLKIADAILFYLATQKAGTK